MKEPINIWQIPPANLADTCSVSFRDQIRVLKKIWSKWLDLLNVYKSPAFTHCACSLINKENYYRPGPRSELPSCE